MGENVLVDAGFVVALLSRRDSHHGWAAARAEQYPPPWKTCESVVSEAFHLIGTAGGLALRALLERRALLVAFDLTADLEPTLKIMKRYDNLPASLADACIVRMTETMADPLVLTTDADFRVYRRHGRAAVPCALPD